MTWRPPVRRSALLVVCLAVFVDMLGFGIILPTLPLHTGSLGGSGAWVGTLLTGYAVAQFVAAPVLGSLSDRYGRRRLLLLALAGSALSMALTGVASSLIMLLLARTVAGCFGGAIAVGQAYAVDLVDKRHRTHALGLVGASIGLGFVVGPAIGAGLAAAGLGFAGICFVAAALAAVNLVAGLFLLPPPERAPRHRRVAGRSTNRLDTLRDALAQSRLRPAMLAMFAITFAFASMETTFALLGAARFGLRPAGLGIVFAGVGLVLVVVQGGVVGRVTERYGHPRVAVAGALLLGVGLLVVPFAPAWLAYVGLGLVAAGQGLLSTTIAALIAESGGRSLGGVLGVSQSAAAAARAIGPIVAGLAYDIGMPLPYVLGALLAVVAAGLLHSLSSEPVILPRSRIAVRK
jgi:DHA1 family tetracycline resistance protein-like MFS transporter